MNNDPPTPKPKCPHPLDKRVKRQDGTTFCAECKTVLNKVVTK